MEILDNKQESREEIRKEKLRALREQCFKVMDRKKEILSKLTPEERQELIDIQDKLRELQDRM